jgi:serine/threonine protein kinase/Tol biopolymer transport system component
MQLNSGTKLAHYEIADAIGKGGMGEVYRAKDTRLGREVAIKLLPEEFTRDAERLGRFEREARVLASLNHPHIAAIHGLEEVGGARFLVMELAPGEDLSARLQRGAIPPPEAIAIAAQIAEALEVAHEKGIIHRDLKPANVKVSDDGGVKLLDFGLAKALELEEGDSDLSNSPTMVRAATHAGIILGTAAYMSPEQARGKKVDKRADIWAFGVVLFEMLSGRRLFSGETVSDTLAAVLTRDADFALLPATVPSNVKALLRRCLERDPKRRLRDIGEARVILTSPESADGAPPVRVEPARTPRALVAGFAIALALLGVAAGWFARAKRSAEANGRVHLEIPFPRRETSIAMLGTSLSPDGTRIAMATQELTGRSHLWLRHIDGFDPKLLAGTDDASQPFWSPDSRSIAFFAGGAIRRLDVASGSVRTVCECAPSPRGGSWSVRGEILFTPDPNAGIMKVGIDGGAVEAVTKVDPSIPDASHRFPQWLPDGKHFLYTLWTNSASAMKTSGGVYVASVDGKTAPRKILDDASSATFVPTGWLLVFRNGAMVAVPFDPATFETGSEALPVDASAMFEPNIGYLVASASARGDLAWNVGRGNPPSKLVSLGRDGSQISEFEPESNWMEIAQSPDGARLAVTRVEGSNATQVWIRELQRSSLSPLTRTVNDSYSAVWAPDGDRIAYFNRDSGTDEIFVRSVSSTGAPEKLFGNPDADCILASWSSDGRYLFFDARLKKDQSQTQVWTYDFAEKKGAPILADNFAQRDATLSSDGRWLAYASNETGIWETFVRPWPALDRKWMVSSGGGRSPHWSRDGGELLFQSTTEKGIVVSAVTFRPDASGPNPSLPVKVAELGADIVELEPSADHQRFLAVRIVESDQPPGVRAILGWSAGRGR